MLERRWPERYAKKDPATIVNVATEGDTTVVNGPLEGPPDGNWLESLKAATRLAEDVQSRPTSRNGKPAESDGEGD